MHKNWMSLRIWNLLINKNIKMIDFNMEIRLSTIIGQTKCMIWMVCKMAMLLLFATRLRGKIFFRTAKYLHFNLTNSLKVMIAKMWNISWGLFKMKMDLFKGCSWITWWIWSIIDCPKAMVLWNSVRAILSVMKLWDICWGLVLF